MSEDVQNNDVQEEAMFTKEQFQEMLDKEVSGLKNKNSELLGKLKDYQVRGEEIKTEAEKAREAALKKEGDFERLKELYEQQKQDLVSGYESKLQELSGAVKERDRQEIINKLVGEFVDTEAGSFVLKNLVDVEDGNQKFKDFSGNIVADNVDDFKKWMKTNPHMAHLVRGTGATGGNATGGKAASNSRSEITRQEFDKLDPGAKMAFIKSGGRTYD